MNAFIDFFDWDEFLLISSEKYTQTSNLVYSLLSSKVWNIFNIAENESQSNIDSLVGRLIKVSTIRKFLIIASEQISYKFVNSIKNNNIYGEGTGILVYGESIAIWQLTG